MLLVKLKIAVSVDRCFLNPCCSAGNILLSSTCAYNLLNITFSKVFEKDVNTKIGL
jgi:hypothetical protein